MRWILLIIILGLGGYAAYVLLGNEEADTSSARGAAKAYLKAAAAGDAQAIQQMCAPGVAKAAQDVAGELKGSPGFHPDGVSFKLMEADPPREGLSGMAGGRVLSMELTPEGDGWKIVMVDLAGL